MATAYKVTATIVNLIASLGLLVFPILAQPESVVHDGFGINVLSAHGLLLIVGALLTGLNVSVLVSKYSAKPSPYDDNSGDFVQRYDAFLARMRHSALTVALSALVLLLYIGDENSYRLGFKPEDEAAEAMDSDLVTVFLWVLVGAVLASKGTLELAHGAVARGQVLDADTQSELAKGYQFKHARGAALTTGALLILYTMLQDSVDNEDSRFRALLSIGAYVAVVAIERALEKIAGKPVEWAMGFVFTGLASTVMVWFASDFVAEAKSAESILVLLGTIMLDSMRVGYGQADRKGLSSDEATTFAVVLQVITRLLQMGVGLIVLAAMERNDIKHFSTVSPVLQGVALASVSVKILSVTYIGKSIFRTGSENNYRNIASAGLLFSAFLLWNLPDKLEIPEAAVTACDALDGSISSDAHFITCECPAGSTGGFQSASDWTGSCTVTTTCTAPAAPAGYTGLTLADKLLDSSWGALDAECDAGFEGTPRLVSCDQALTSEYSLKGCERDLKCGDCEPATNGLFKCSDGAFAYEDGGAAAPAEFAEDAYVCGKAKDDHLNPWSVTFLIFALGCKFLDSLMNFTLKAIEDQSSPVEYITGPKSTLIGRLFETCNIKFGDEDKDLNKPSVDNPRTWIVFGALLASLGFTAVLYHRVQDDSVNLATSLIWALVLLSVHLAVALAQIVADTTDDAYSKLLALSRSPLVRFLVSSGVIVAFAIAGGRMRFGEGGSALADVDDESYFVIAVLAYITVADVFGRQFL